MTDEDMTDEDMTDEEIDDVSCPKCRISVGLGMYLNICREIGDKQECDILYDKLMNDEITPEEIFTMVREKAKDKPEQLDMLNYIDTLMKGVDVEE